MTKERPEQSEHHYVYGSGMHGCLYDWGPNFSETIDEAIDSIKQIFGDQLEEGEEEELERDLRADGIHRFRNPQNAGAQYCDATRQTGACPEDDDD